MITKMMINEYVFVILISTRLYIGNVELMLLFLLKVDSIRDKVL